MSPTGLLLVLYTLTIFLGAALLFLVQPMFARMVLPLLGGSPAVWNTAMVFYQGALLAGYAYAHFTTARLGVRRQAAWHLPLLFLPLLALPIHVPGGWTPPTEGNPIPWLLLLLTVAVGLPFLVVATTSPLLQRWFAATGHPAARDPYFLYAASNAGSLLGLVSYPALIEPKLTLQQQGQLWSLGYGLLVALTIGCAVRLWRARTGAGADLPANPADDPGIAPAPRPSAPIGERTPRTSSRVEARNGSNRREEALFTRLLRRLSLLTSAATDSRFKGGKSAADSFQATEITPRRRWRWVALAFVPSSLLLSVTGYLTSDIAAVPLLWVVPLAIYLGTFILAFARRTLVPHWLAQRALPLALVPVVMAIASGSTTPIALLMGVHLVAFAAAGLVCHGELARDRPPPELLTEFYLWISVGGVLGGAFTALLAPVLFNWVIEYDLMLVAAAWLGLPREARKTARQRALDFALPAGLGLLALGLRLVVRSDEALDDPVTVGLVFGVPSVLCYLLSRHPLRFSLGLAVILGVSLFAPARDDRLVFIKRSFFGIHRVTLDETGTFHRLIHGKTVHGMQNLAETGRPTPLTYYHPTGPAGQLFAALGDRLPGPVAAVGLGTGALAAYGRPGQEWVFYEIDPVVQRIASDPRYFTFLRDTAADVRVQLGDARLSLQRAPDGRFGLIVLDAYSSDSIPVHLITREALRLYLDKLAPGGLLLFHASNLHLDLEPVLVRLAADANLAWLVQDDSAVSPAESAAGKSPSLWIVMARTREELAPLAHDPRWQARRATAGRVWTDDYSSVFGVFNWRLE